MKPKMPRQLKRKIVISDSCTVSIPRRSFITMAFALELSSLDSQLKRKIAKNLAVRPKKTQYDPEPKLKYVFASNRQDDAIYLPLGQHTEYLDDFPHLIDEYPRTDLEFAFELYTAETDPKDRGRDQKTVARQAINRLKSHKTVFVSCFTGYGKCLAPGTEVLMFDGSKKIVENISVGDVLMGDDSTPRNVMSVCSGEEQMYEIVPAKGESFCVNESHILSLKASGQGRIQYVPKRDRHIVHWFDGEKCTSQSFVSREEAVKLSAKVSVIDVFDIEVRDYIKLHDQAKHILKCYWAPVEYAERPTSIEPRLLGIWLGDGTSADTTVTTVDDEIMTYLEEYAKRHDLKYEVVYDLECVPLCELRGKTGRGSSHTNHLLSAMKELNLIGNKHIPLVYKANSRRVRLELLAGLIDTDGYYSRGCYEITQKNKCLAYDIQDICRSLGFACFVYPTTKSCTYKGEKREGLYYRVSFSGVGLEEIPVLLKRKRGEARRQAKDPLVVGFKIVPKEVGIYHGFEIDGNRRFLLGSHMVTHNTTLGTYLMCWSKLKTIVMVHNDTLKGQWRDEITKFTGGQARVQIIQGRKPLDPDADVYIVGVQKAKTLEREDLIDIGMVIVDEAHICTSTAFTKSLLRFQPMYLVGLSATPDRVDGLHSLLYLYFGSSKEFIVREEVKDFTVVKYQTNYKPEVSYTVVRGKTTLAWTNMMTSLSVIEKRWKEIAELALAHPDNKIIVLCDRQSLAENIYKYLIEKGDSAELLIGNKKKWDRTKRVLVAGVKKGGVGLNDESLDMLILAADMKDVRQCEGRIRTTGNTVYDIVDDYSTLENHWNKRERWYLKRGATITIGGTRVVKKTTRNKPAAPARRYLPSNRT